MSALGHKQTFSPILAQCPVSGVKRPRGTRILEGYDLNARERLLSPKAVTQTSEIWEWREAAFGRKRTFRYLSFSLSIKKDQITREVCLSLKLEHASMVSESCDPMKRYVVSGELNDSPHIAL